MNGRIYESLQARIERRPPLDLYHTALVVRVPEGRFVIENAWPSPNRDVTTRGVVLEGPVFSRLLFGIRAFRYEVRRWRDGVIADADQAVDSPRTVCSDEVQAMRLLEAVHAVPALMWGRDEGKTGEMWNSNSVVSWLLTRAGVPVDAIHPPAGGRAPGWDAGIAVARS